LRSSYSGTGSWRRSRSSRPAFNRTVASRLPDYDLAAIAAGLGIECIPLSRDADVDAVLERVRGALAEGRSVFVDTAIDYTSRTYFTRGVVRTMLGRLPWSDRLRFVARAVVRKVTG